MSRVKLEMRGKESPDHRWTKWMDCPVDFTNLAPQFTSPVAPPVKITMLFCDGSKIQYREKKK